MRAASHTGTAHRHALQRNHDIVWQWTSVTTKPTGETTTVTDPQNYTITFRDDGTLSGKADCNSFTGTYSQEGGFTITLGASTMAACAEGSLDQQYLELLSAVVAGGPDGQGNLALENAGGEKRMLFVNGGPASANSPHACPRAVQRHHRHRLEVANAGGCRGRRVNQSTRSEQVHHCIQDRRDNDRTG